MDGLQQIEVDNSLIIQHLTQQIAQQSLRIAVLEAHISSMGSRPVPETVDD